VGTAASSVRAGRAPWAVAGAVACSCVAVAVVDPTEHALTPPCPFRLATGWWCPFCGGTRAVSRLLRGDLGEAWRYNAAALALLPVAVLLWVAWLTPGRFAPLDALRRAAWRPRVAWSLAVALVGFVVARNVGWGVEHLRFPGA